MAGTREGNVALRLASAEVYGSAMIAIKAEKDRVEVSIPTEGMTPEDVNDFISWLRVESVARRSQLTPQAARELSEEIKSDWWQANQNHFVPRGS
jgi:hypothetical protein